MVKRKTHEVDIEILEILKKEGELSIRSVASKAKCQWRTALESLSHYSNLGLVKERKGKKTNKEERLFSLADTRASYGSKK